LTGKRWPSSPTRASKERRPMQAWRSFVYRGLGLQGGVVRCAATLGRRLMWSSTHAICSPGAQFDNPFVDRQRPSPTCRTKHRQEAPPSGEIARGCSTAGPDLSGSRCIPRCAGRPYVRIGVKTRDHAEGITSARTYRAAASDCASELSPEAHSLMRAPARRASRQALVAHGPASKRRRSS
jgi:hypothetical protein